MNWTLPTWSEEEGEARAPVRLVWLVACSQLIKSPLDLRGWVDCLVSLYILLSPVFCIPLRISVINVLNHKRAPKATSACRRLCLDFCP